MFFSYNKSVNSNFWHDLSAKRTRRHRIRSLGPLYDHYEMWSDADLPLLLFVIVIRLSINALVIHAGTKSKMSLTMLAVVLSYRSDSANREEEASCNFPLLSRTVFAGFIKRLDVFWTSHTLILWIFLINIPLVDSWHFPEQLFFYLSLAFICTGQADMAFLKICW